jgi:hypothetical protein
MVMKYKKLITRNVIGVVQLPQLRDKELIKRTMKPGIMLKIVPSFTFE